MLVFAVAVGCGPQVGIPDEMPPGDGSASTSEDAPRPATSTSGVPPAATTSTTAADTSTSGPSATDEDTGMSFITPGETSGCGIGEPPPGTSFHCSWCDIWAQDCREGEKCTAWSNDGGPGWNASRCVPVSDEPGQQGDPCTSVESGSSGIDTCDLGLMCWNVDPTSLEGTCESFCAGSRQAPTCPAGRACAIDFDGAIALCLEPCDPLMQDCAEGQCVPLGETFSCMASIDAVAPGQGCDFAADCEAGSTCLDASFVPGCTDFECCAAFCDLGAPDPDAACGPLAECRLFGMEALPGYEDVGVCTDTGAM